MPHQFDHEPDVLSRGSLRVYQLDTSVPGLISSLAVRKRRRLLTKLAVFLSWVFFLAGFLFLLFHTGPL